MASIFMCFTAVLCALKCVQSADLQGAVDVARTAVKALQQRIADADIKAQSIVQNASLQASQVLGSTLTALQHMAQDVIEKIKLYVQTGRNIQTCITGQSEAARRVVTLAGQDLQTCVQTMLSTLQYYSADITDLGLQVLRLLQGIPAQTLGCISRAQQGVLSCLATVAQNTSSKGLLLASSLSHDTTQLTVSGAQLPGQLANCGTSQIAKTASQLANILATTDACVKYSFAAA